MSPLWLFYIIIPVLVGFLIAEYKSDILKLVRAQFFDGDIAENQNSSSLDLHNEEVKRIEHEYEAVIFVPSARNNFNKRAAIRNTWLGQLQTNSSVREKLILKFVVGIQPCTIHPDDRLSPFSCEEWNVDLPGSKGDDIRAIEEVDSDGSEAEKLHVYGIQSLPFTVHYPIVLSKLGVFRECVSNGANVRLLEASTQREIVGATFSKESRGVLIGDFWYKAVEPYYLPKGFEGVVVGDSLNSGSTKLPVTKWNRSKATRTNNSSGVIRFRQDDVLPDGHYEDVRKWNSFPVHIVSFIYSIHEYEDLRRHVQSKATRKENWNFNNSIEQQSLTEEMQKYDDIKMVDLVDVYQNLPDKFLRFTEWVTTALKFNFLLKTDDDCFLDVVRILDRLQSLKGATKTWLGRFRHNWLVEKHGKWAERKYTSIFYPKFACGSGYVLTADLVHWVAKNAHILEPYQGEDVSMGIWMAAIAPQYIDEPLWQCEKDCLSNMYSMPELRQDELQRIWTDLMTCGDPCGCN